MPFGDSNFYSSVSQSQSVMIPPKQNLDLSGLLTGFFEIKNLRLKSGSTDGVEIEITEYLGNGDGALDETIFTRKSTFNHSYHYVKKRLERITIRNLSAEDVFFEYAYGTPEDTTSSVSIDGAVAVSEIQSPVDVSRVLNPVLVSHIPHKYSNMGANLPEGFVTQKKIDARAYFIRDIRGNESEWKFNNGPLNEASNDTTNLKGFFSPDILMDQTTGIIKISMREHLTEASYSGNNDIVLFIGYAIVNRSHCATPTTYTFPDMSTQAYVTYRNRYRNFSLLTGFLPPFCTQESHSRLQYIPDPQYENRSDVFHQYDILIPERYLTSEFRLDFRLHSSASITEGTTRLDYDRYSSFDLLFEY